MTTRDALRRVSQVVARLARSDTPVKRRNARRALAGATRLLRRKVDEEYPRIAPPRLERVGARTYVSWEARIRTVQRRLSRGGWVPIPPERKNQVMADCLAARVPVRFMRTPPHPLHLKWPWVRKWVLVVPPGDVGLMRECRGNATKQRAMLSIELLQQEEKGGS